MNLKIQKKLAAQILKCSPSKVVLNTERLDDIKESITKIDIRNLIKSNAISKRDTNGPSHTRARKNAEQKRKGRRTGQGSRKGKSTARLGSKRDWINRIRKQKEILKSLRDKKTVSTATYRKLYGRAKGGFFRSQRHLKIYLNEIVKENK